MNKIPKKGELSFIYFQVIVANITDFSPVISGITRHFATVRILLFTEYRTLL